MGRRDQCESYENGRLPGGIGCNFAKLSPGLVLDARQWKHEWDMLFNVPSASPRSNICATSARSTLEEDDDWPNALFELSHDKYRPLQVNAKNNSGAVPLLYALKQGRKKLTEILLRQGANPNSRNQNGMTPLHCVCAHSADVDLLRMFYDINEELHQTVHTNAKDKHWPDTVIPGTAPRDMRQMVKFLLMAGADPSIACGKGVTPLHVVCDKYRDSSSLATILLQLSHERYRPLQINPQDKLGNTPLHMAMARRNNKNLVKLLLRHGARPNMINKAGWMPLHKLLDRRDCDKELLRLFSKSTRPRGSPCVSMVVTSDVIRQAVAQVSVLDARTMEARMAMLFNVPPPHPREVIFCATSARSGKQARVCCVTISGVSRTPRAYYSDNAIIITIIINLFPKQASQIDRVSVTLVNHGQAQRGPTLVTPRYQGCLVAS
ncbi:unnamed protein product, partial [Trichogramma brassicae]